MKKYLVVCAAALLLLPCFPLLSQEADEPGPGVEFTVVPRLDVSYEDGGLALGNSSIYSLFVGSKDTFCQYGRLSAPWRSQD